MKSLILKVAALMMVVSAANANLSDTSQGSIDGSQAASVEIFAASKGASKEVYGTLVSAVKTGAEIVVTSVSYVGEKLSVGIQAVSPAGKEVSQASLVFSKNAGKASVQALQAGSKLISSAATTVSNGIEKSVIVLRDASGNLIAIISENAEINGSEAAQLDQSGD